MLPFFQSIGFSAILWSAIVIAVLYIVFKILHGLGRKQGARVIDMEDRAMYKKYNLDDHEQKIS